MKRKPPLLVVEIRYGILTINSHSKNKVIYMKGPAIGPFKLFISSNMVHPGVFCGWVFTDKVKSGQLFLFYPNEVVSKVFGIK